MCIFTFCHIIQFVCDVEYNRQRGGVNGAAFLPEEVVESRKNDIQWFIAVV